MKNTLNQNTGVYRRMHRLAGSIGRGPRFAALFFAMLLFATSVFGAESSTEAVLAGAGREVTIHFGEDGQDVHIRVNPESDAQTLPEQTAAETEAETSAAKAPTAEYVDQFGDPIGETYAGMELPSFDEEGVLDLVATEDYTPVESFAVPQEAASKVIQYTYSRARMNYRGVSAIKKEQAPNGEITYLYTYDDETWEAFGPEDALQFVFTSGKQKDYVYEDAHVKVTASLRHAWAIPDGAQLQVTQITPDSELYNYDAYMEALNQTASASDSSILLPETEAETEAGGTEEARYHEGNTLLYDIAFIAAQYDASGLPVEGTEYEYEPADGAVSISFAFKNSQLTGEIGLEEEDEVSVLHLPLSQEVKDEVHTTAEAVHITASDITVEPVSVAAENVNLQEGKTDTVAFEAESFSTFVFAKEYDQYWNPVQLSQDHYWEGSRQFSITDILNSLGGLTNFAVVADKLITGDHIEGNIRVNTFAISSNGAEMNSGGRVDTYNNPDTITVTKTVENGENGTFRFAIVDETSGNTLHTFPLTTSDQSDQTRSASVTFTAEGGNGTLAAPEVFRALLQEKHVIRVYELDEKGNPVQEGGTSGEAQVTYSGTDTTNSYGGEIGNLRNNYVGSFDYTGEGTLGMAKDKLDPLTVGEQPHLLDGAPGNYIYIGEDNDVCMQNASLEDFTYDPLLSAKISADMGSVAELSTELARAYNGDTETAGSKNFGSNLNVINVVSTTGELIGDLRNAHFVAGNSSENTIDVIKGLIAQGEFLLINIDVGDRSNYVLNAQTIFFDGVNPQGNNGYSELGSHVIYNLVSSTDGQNTFRPYAGRLQIADWSAGLLLAPRSDIAQDSYWVGEIIGKSVTHTGAEIHKKTIVSGQDRHITVDVVNTYPNFTELTVEKVWSDGNGAHDGDPVQVELHRVLTPAIAAQTSDKTGSAQTQQAAGPEAEDSDKTGSGNAVSLKVTARNSSWADINTKTIASDIRGGDGFDLRLRVIGSGTGDLDAPIEVYCWSGLSFRNGEAVNNLRIHPTYSETKDGARIYQYTLQNLVAPDWDSEIFLILPEAYAGGLKGIKATVSSSAQDTTPETTAQNPQNETSAQSDQEQTNAQSDAGSSGQEENGQTGLIEENGEDENNNGAKTPGDLAIEQQTGQTQETEPVETDSILRTLTLNKDNGWRQTLDDLPQTQTINGVVYNCSYYAVETNPKEGYTVTCTSGDQTSAVSSGTITVTNTRQTGELVLRKTSVGHDTPESTLFTVIGPDGKVAAQVRYGAFSVPEGAEDDVPVYVITGLEAGRYTVTEKTDSSEDGAMHISEDTNATYSLLVTYSADGGSTSHDSGSATVPAGGSAEIEIANKYTTSYTMPATGGAGTGALQLTGLLLILLAGTFWTLRRKSFIR